MPVRLDAMPIAPWHKAVLAIVCLQRAHLPRPRGHRRTQSSTSIGTPPYRRRLPASGGPSRDQIRRDLNCN